MRLESVSAIAVIVAGSIGMIIGYIERCRGGRYLLWVGGALVVGQMPQLLSERASDALRAMFPICSIVLVLAGIFSVVIDARRRQVSQRK
jgi:hypothetical protein